MSIVVGSLRYTTSGRKRKKITTNRRKKFEPGIVTTRENPLAAKAREDRNKYPSRDFGGTNCLALWPPNLMEPAFGADSFQRHCKLVEDLGIKPIVLELDGFALDIDTSEDLRLFCMGQNNCGSLQYLQASGISARILSD